MSAVPAPDFTLLRMHESDIEEVLAIEREVYEFPWTLGNFRDSIRAGYQCRLGLRDGMAVGYFVLLVAAAEAHLLNLSVAAAEQRRGYGSVLLGEAARLSRDGGASLMYLEVRPSNAAGRALYRRNGLREIGVRNNYYPAASGREDALVLALDL